jgi:uroporphyrinogen III methyltransferase / synthase
MPHPPNPVQPSFESNDPAEEEDRPHRTGKVFLVGAGPGDPGLLTVRGQACLAEADVVLYDGLASEQILEQAPKAECISVGKHGQIPLWSQAEINRRMLDLACSGKRVVRLKGGDPAVFARTAEELEVLANHQIPFEVVPGITAALAAASYVGIPITHRRFASAVAFVTGQQNADEPQSLDWQALAHFPGTLVFYMGVTTAEQWTGQLISAGKPGSTPAAIVRRCTWPDQTVIRCTLAEVAQHLTPASRMRPPVIVIVGSVAELGANFDWFASRPLHGCRVLVTRATGQQDNLVGQLRDLGAEVFHQPAFTVEPSDDIAAMDRAIDELQQGEVAGITFSSSNGVDGLLRRIAERHLDCRVFAGAKLAAVGTSTAEQLQRYGLRCDLQPPPGVEQSATGLLLTLRSIVSSNQRWWVTTTNRSRATMRDGLRQLGARVEECLTYRTQPVEELLPAVRHALEAGLIHYVTITSGLVAEATAGLLGNNCQRVRPIAISAHVATVLASCGWPAAAIARENSSAAIAIALCDQWAAARPTDQA